MNAQYQAIASQPGLKVNLFMKALSQAFAQASTGDVYLFTKLDQEPSVDLDFIWRNEIAWGGWEYPALTRNFLAVTRILRANPRTG